MYMSRLPSNQFRHITTICPLASTATDGWQHSQIVPPGDSQIRTFFDHVAPASTERAL